MALKFKNVPKSSQVQEQIQEQPPQVKTLEEMKAKHAHQALIEQFVHLHQKVVELKIKEIFEEYEQMKKQLAELSMDMPSGQPAVFTCELGRVEFSPRVMKTMVTDKQKLIDLLTPDVALKIANISLTDAKTYLSGVELSKVTESQPAHRTLKSVVVY